MIKRKYRLKQASDFEHVRQTGSVHKHPLLILIAASNQLGYPRVGVVAGKGLGKAFQRNLVKRRLRASVAPYLSDLKAGWDIILIGRKPSVDASFSQIQEALDRLLHRTGIELSVSKQE